MIGLVQITSRSDRDQHEGILQHTGNPNPSELNTRSRVAGLHGHLPPAHPQGPAGLPELMEWCARDHDENDYASYGTRRTVPRAHALVSNRDRVANHRWEGRRRAIPLDSWPY
jgi:hypothetical protein